MSPHRRRFFFVLLMGIGAIIFIGLTSTPSSTIPYDVIFRRQPNDFLENDHNSSGETNLTDIFDLSPDWIPVDSRKLFLKSAYLDLSSKRPRRLHVLANMACTERRAVRCVFHSIFARSDDPASSTIADVEVINSPPDGDRCSKPNYYESHYLHCRMPKFSEGLALFRPTSVSVIPEPQDSKTRSTPSRLPINYIPELRYQFSVCVPPLYDWTDTHSLVLFFEYYISQGADRFLVYNYSSSRATGIVLKHYEQLGLVRIVQWPRLPLLSDGSDANPRTFYHGEILMMNDCLWQLRAKTEFAAMVDLDEFIVPSDMENRTILELLKKLDRSNIGSFMFMHTWSNTYFPWNDREFDDLNDTDSWMSLFNMSKARVTRNSEVSLPTIRSKVIVKPSAVRRQTIHQVWGFQHGYTRYEVQPSVALMYHFRRKKLEGFDGKSDPTMMNMLLDLFK